MSTKLQTLIDQVERLPEHRREALIQELSEHVAEFTGCDLSDAQHAEVIRRMAEPAESVPDEAVREILRRYNPAL